MVAAFYVATIREGHSWGDDFAMYIHHARNLVNGLPYLATGYIVNPGGAHNLGPRFYPPGFPLILAPVIKLFGENITAMKVEVIGSFVFSLAFMFFLFRDRLPYWWAFALVGLVGFNPGFWRYKDEVISDLPFLLFAYAGMYLVGVLSSRARGVSGAIYGVPVGVSVYFAYAIRPLGAMLLPAVMICDFIKERRVSGFAAVAAIVMGGCACIQALVLHGDDRYGLLDFSPGWLVPTAVRYVKDYRGFWLNGYWQLFSYALFFVVLPVTLYGLWLSVRSGVRVYDLFAAFYMAVTVAYRDNMSRYLLPVVPVLALYLLVGLRGIRRRLPADAAMAGTVCALAAVVFSYGSMYLKADQTPIREGLFDPEFADLCRYIRANTSPASRFLFRKPRLLSLATNRAAAVYHTPDDRAELWEFARSKGVSYIVLADVPDGDFATDRTYLRGLIDAYHDSLALVFQNPHYKLFRVSDARPLDLDLRRPS